MDNLNDFTDTHLEEKIAKLNKVYFVTQNEDVRQQIILSLDTLKLELQSRRVRQQQQLLEDSEENGLDNLINIS
jgi:hypothetical protein